MISIQAGKNFNTPLTSFLGDIGFYGGIGFESSSYDLTYIYSNPYGEPIDMSLSFTGDNKFRSLIGTRIKILFADVYIDYNMGASKTINAGFGITFR